MKLIALKCPCCNGDINVESDRDFCFCQYCGTKIVVEDETKKLKSVAVSSRSLEAENLLKRAKRFESTGEENLALEYYDKVLDVDADNQEALDSIERIRTTITDDNLIIKYEKTGGLTPKVDLYIDGEHIGKMARGETKGFTCPVGSHTIEIVLDVVRIKAVYYVPDKYVDGALTFGFWDGLKAIGYGDVRVITKRQTAGQQADRRTDNPRKEKRLPYKNNDWGNSDSGSCFYWELRFLTLKGQCKKRWPFMLEVQCTQYQINSMTQLWRVNLLHCVLIFLRER